MPSSGGFAATFPTGEGSGAAGDSAVVPTGVCKIPQPIQNSLRGFLPSKKATQKGGFFDAVYFDAMYFSCHRTLARLASFVPLRISETSSSASAKVISPSPFMSL